jgi:hypothetical protein
MEAGHTAMPRFTIISMSMAKAKVIANGEGKLPWKETQVNLGLPMPSFSQLPAPVYA